jgi:hypothetical protein
VLAVVNAEKIGKLIKMLSSSSDGEIVAAARALMRTLAQEGADIHDLAARVEGGKLSKADMQRIYDQAYRDGKEAATASAAETNAGFHSVDLPTFHGMACEIQHKANGRLSEKEQGFVDDMVRWCAYREPSEKQAKWLHALYCKIGRHR